MLDQTKSLEILENKLFKCSSNAHKIPSTYFNDDFCDCADGSDEPHSSACSANVLTSRFQCTNEGYDAHFIFFSRVGDGICDCCDGSDEAVGLCTNTCEAMAEIQKKTIAQRLAGWQKGIKMRDTRLLEATNSIVERIKTLNLKRESIVNLKSSLARQETAVSIEEQLERDERLEVDRRLAQALELTLRLSELPHNILSSVLVPHTTLSCFESGVEAAIELAGGDSVVEDEVELLLIGVSAREDNDTSQYLRQLEDGLRLRTFGHDQLVKWAFKLASHCGNYCLW